MYVCQKSIWVKGLHKSELKHFPDTFPKVKVKITWGAFTRWKLCNRKAEPAVTYEDKLQYMCGQLGIRFTCQKKHTYNIVDNVIAIYKSLIKTV